MEKYTVSKLNFHFCMKTGERSALSKKGVKGMKQNADENVVNHHQLFAVSIALKQDT
jgi:hypothetical protein